MDVVQFCLKDHIKPGDDLYYALLYSRVKNPEQLIACALFQNILHSAMTIEDDSVSVAKLGWWSTELQKAESNHPLIQFMAQQNHHDWLLEAMLPVTHQLLKHPTPLTLNNYTFIESEAGLSLTWALGTKINKRASQNSEIAKVDSMEKVDSLESYANAIFQFWLLKTSFSLNAKNALSISPSPEMISNTLQRITGEFEAFSIKQSRSRLSPACYYYLNLAKQWLTLNQLDKQSSNPIKQASENETSHLPSLYEPSSLRKLTRVWLLHHFSFI